MGLFRIGRQEFFMLIHSISGCVANANHKDIRGLTIEEKVGVTLYQLGNGSSYETVGHFFNIGKSTAFNISQAVVQAILLSLHDTTIIFPDFNDMHAWNTIKESFRRRQGLSNIVGAIDGTHIPIIPPPNDGWKSYLNSKGWHYIAFQCIVDGHGKFQNVFGGFPGAIHDSHMLWKSRIGKDLINGTPRSPSDMLLIGDLVYSEKVPILTPSRNSRNEEHIRFNTCHSSTR
ncbi:hypothetical protein O181_033563 [Austropuccinia psidii MF-1]|uniref:DDE Tnp4 domain-containing protein n=1 Tax=Austropuccinia psidii MF-1 TaxID=1389203 RepID=A0A9Q3D1R6_9BASI|nr:hypothetical protein [Austropuccinia psidii MF-1]